MAKLRYLVTLVHGTFADEPEKREWTLRGSAAYEGLKNSLQGGDSAVVEFTPPFEWTGRNSHKSRLTAANELASMLRTETRVPGDRRVVIGHSHGGNVILYALRKLLADGAEDLVDGVVCLATPHIRATPRPLEESFKVIGFLGAVFSVLVYFVLSCLALVLLFGEGEVGPLSGILALLLFLSLQPAFRFIRFLIEGPAHDRVRRTADSNAIEIQAAAPPATPILSLQVTRDEAQGVLGFAEAAAASPFPIWRLITRVASPFLIVAIIAFFVLPDPGPGVIFGKARLGLLIAVFVAPVACLLVLWVLSLLRLPAFGFDESWITRLCLDVGVAAEPVGFESSHCEQKTFETSGLEPGLGGLAHSMPYQSEKILGYAAEWIIKATGSRSRP
jgi:hypothetical protein